MLDDISTAQAGLSENRLGRVSDWLLDQTKKDRLAGCSVLVGR